MDISHLSAHPPKVPDAVLAGLTQEKPDTLHNDDADGDPRRSRRYRNLTDMDDDLLKRRLPGEEYLMNHMLAHASDEEIPQIIRTLHDWVRAGNASERFQDYFKQPAEQLDEVIALYLANRPPPGTDGRREGDNFRLIPLYLLFDCLLHVGATHDNERGMAWLEGRKQAAPAMTVAEFLAKGRSGQIYNWVFQDGAMKIASKDWHHSEIADGQALQGAGEVDLQRSPAGRIEKLRINYFTGHYRVTPDALETGLQALEAGLEEHLRGTGHTGKPPRIHATDRTLYRCEL